MRLDKLQAHFLEGERVEHPTTSNSDNARYSWASNYKADSANRATKGNDQSTTTRCNFGDVD